MYRGLAGSCVSSRYCGGTLWETSNSLSFQFNSTQHFVKQITHRMILSYIPVRECPRIGVCRDRRGPQLWAPLHTKQRSKYHVRESFLNEFFGNGDDGIEEEKFDTSNFVPLEDSKENVGLDGSTEQTFGPLAILAAGLTRDEYGALQLLLDEMGADEVTLLPYSSTSMATKSLGEVLESFVHVDNPLDVVQVGEEEENKKPVAFLSGMYQSEIVEVVTALRYCDELPDMAFAALVPNNYARMCHQLIESVWSDHQAVAAMRRQAEQQEE